MLLYTVTICKGAVTEFSLNATATYSGNTITVTYEVSSAAMCTCQLNQMAAVPCKSCSQSNSTILLLSIYFR